MVLPLLNNEMEEDIEFEIVDKNNDDSLRYEKYFNIYDYCNVNSNILNNIEPYSNSVNVSLHWIFLSGTYINKNDVIGTIKIFPLGVNYHLKSNSDGYIFIKDSFSQGSLLFTIYPKMECCLKEKYNKFEIVEEKDIFTRDLKLFWKVVANRYIDHLNLIGMNAFEMSSEKLSIYLSFEYFKEAAHIILGIKSTDLTLRNGDTFSLLLEKGDNHKVLNFTIVDTPTKIDNSKKNLYDTIFSFALYHEDLECLQSHFCTNWRISFANNRRLPITGLNRSKWTPSTIAYNVFNRYAKCFCNELNNRNIEIVHCKSDILNQPDTTIIADSCFVYLMHDTTNGFYKIGISNNPEYREKTLQSEKPTIELVCCKEYPIRSIAEAFESALHKVFSNKRIRGEWFTLTESDVMILKKTLN